MSFGPTLSQIIRFIPMKNKSGYRRKVGLRFGSCPALNTWWNLLCIMSHVNYFNLDNCDVIILSLPRTIQQREDAKNWVPYELTNVCFKSYPPTHHLDKRHTPKM